MTHPVIKLDTLFNGEMFIEVSKFRSNFFWEFIWFPVQGKACLQVGTSSDPITFVLRSGFNIMECYKTIIKTFTQWDQWDINKLRTNGLFDLCRASTSTTAQIFRWDFYSYSNDVDNMITPDIVFNSDPTPAIDPTVTPAPFCFTLPYFFNT